VTPSSADSSPRVSRPDQFPGLPGWTRGSCLGCAGVVKAARHAHVVLGGRRDGSGLVVFGAKADAMLAEELDALPRDSLFLLGVAHRECIESARDRLHRGQAELPAVLPDLLAEEIDELPEEFHHPPTGKFCPLCGSSDITVEHVWPLWMSRALRKHIGAGESDRPFTMRDDKRRSRTIDIEAPACGLCNSRWLSVLEQDVRPILEPMVLGQEERILSREEQLLLATWALKTVLMFDVASGDQAVIPMGYYREFANLRTPLPSTQIWIGAYLGNAPVLAYRDALWIDIPHDEPPNAFVATITAFRVVFQVVGHFVKAASFRDRRYQFAPAIHRIWPVASGSVRWPARNNAFGDESLREFAHSFEGRHPDA
jgi:hypothetical protein